MKETIEDLEDKLMTLEVQQEELDHEISVLIDRIDDLRAEEESV